MVIKGNLLIWHLIVDEQICFENFEIIPIVNTGEFQIP